MVDVEKLINTNDENINVAEKIPEEKHGQAAKLKKIQKSTVSFKNSPIEKYLKKEDLLTDFGHALKIIISQIEKIMDVSGLLSHKVVCFKDLPKNEKQKVWIVSTF